MTDVHITRGHSPLIVSFPHVGTDIPDDIAGRMTPAALRLDDTDFEQPALYDFVEEMDAATVTARWSRLVVDVNRPPDNKPLYPGQWGAGLVPFETFHGEPVYLGAAPDEAEIAARRDRYWRPYHDALKAAIDAAVDDHGFALLWDAHSISAVVPKLFEGTLPDLNMGTADGAACGEEARGAAFGVLRSSGFNAVLDGRFKGGSRWNWPRPPTSTRRRARSTRPAPPACARCSKAPWKRRSTRWGTGWRCSAVPVLSRRRKARLSRQIISRQSETFRPFRRQSGALRRSRSSPAAPVVSYWRDDAISTVPPEAGKP
jgi:N-formylglutamate deformylase